MLAYRYNVPSRFRQDTGAITIKSPPPARAPSPRIYNWATARAVAATGALPPRFPTTSPRWTDRRYSGPMQHLVDLAQRGDLQALRTVPLRSYDSAWRAMQRWRALAVQALEVRAAESVSQIQSVAPTV